MPVNNQLHTLTTTINESQNFASVVAGWSWRASNAGPSGSQIVDSGVGTGKCLQLTGGSLGHYEELQFLGFLDPHGSYRLSYSVKADVSFATQLGDAGWYLQFFTSSSESVRLLVSNAAAATTQWQTIGPVPLDCATLAATLGLNSHVIKVGLLLVNAKYTANSSPAASLYVTDILLSGTSTAQPYSYDANGNVTAAPARNLTMLGYEPFSGLPSVVTLAGVEAQSVRYAYDAAGLRSAAVTDYGGGQQDKTLYLRDPLGNLIMQRQLRNGVETATSYLQCRSGLLAAHTESGEQYILTDLIGSTRAVISSTAGTGVQDYDYGPYGEVLASAAGNELPYRYTGQEQDPTLGIDNYNARLYDPALRRFYAADPAGQYPSPYIYVGNDPILRIDPDGSQGIARAIPFVIGFSVVVLAITSVPGFVRHLDCKYRIFCDPGPGKYAMNMRNRIQDFQDWVSYDWENIERAAVVRKRSEMSSDPSQLEVYYPKSKKTELLSQVPSYYNDYDGTRKYNYVYFAHSKELRVWQVRRFEEALAKGSHFHSQLAGGKNVDCAGEIFTLFGKIYEINPQTGHYYKDDPEFNLCVSEVEKHLIEFGYQMSDLKEIEWQSEQAFLPEQSEKEEL